MSTVVVSRGLLLLYFPDEPACRVQVFQPALYICWGEGGLITLVPACWSLMLHLLQKILSLFYFSYQGCDLEGHKKKLSMLKQSS